MIRIKILVKIRARGEKEKETIIKSLKPDNTGFPKNIRFNETVSNNEITYYLEGGNEKIKTLKNTVDEILQQIDVLSQNIKIVGDNKKHKNLPTRDK